jgi:hypothetical protein
VELRGVFGTRLPIEGHRVVVRTCAEPTWSTIIVHFEIKLFKTSSDCTARFDARVVTVPAVPYTAMGEPSLIHGLIFRDTRVRFPESDETLGSSTKTTLATVTIGVAQLCN